MKNKIKLQGSVVMKRYGFNPNALDAIFNISTVSILITFIRKLKAGLRTEYVPCRPIPNLIVNNYQ